MQVFEVHNVEEDNVRISTFVAKKFGSFEREKVFYEFNQDEDLLFYKQLALWKRKRRRSEVDNICGEVLGLF